MQAYFARTPADRLLRTYFARVGVEQSIDSLVEYSAEDAFDSDTSQSEQRQLADQ